jgi:dihydrolipoamide dehydrogenase
MKIAILGGGPGGYVAAIRAAQLGAEVVLIEEKHIGGTCLNVGCIPTKVLLHTAELYKASISEFEELGIIANNVKIDWNKLMERKKNVVNTMVKGVQLILRSYKVKVIRGRGVFISDKEIEVMGVEGEKERVEFDYCIIATGSSPIVPTIPNIELENIVTSEEGLSFNEIPESLCIVGGGVIGTEFANVFSNLGTKVTIVEMLPNIVDNMDQEIIQFLRFNLEKNNVNIMTDTKVEAFEKEGKKVIVKISGENAKETISFDKVLLSIGRKANISGIGLENTGVKFEKAIAVDKYMKTNVESIYAIGDCNGGVMLAHVASAEGITAVEAIMKKSPKIDFKTIPYCVYTKPEIASVGITEKEAREKGYNVKTGKFPVYGNGKAVICGEKEGIFKYVIDGDTEEILGLHIAGPRATELIVEGALAIRLEATIQEIITTIHAHPTVGEALHEAAHAAHGGAIHMTKQS